MKSKLLTGLIIGLWLGLFQPSAEAQTCSASTQTGTPCTRSTVFYGEILPSGCTSETVVQLYSPGEYFRMPVLQGGCYSISTCNSTIDTQLAAYEGNGTTAVAYNDDNGPGCSGTAASIDLVSTFTDYARVDVRQYNCSPGGTASITIRVKQNNNLNFTSTDSAMCQGQIRTLTATPATVTATPQPSSGDIGSFSGTNVSGTQFTAPVPPGDSLVDTITYTFGYCSTQQTIAVYRNPSLADAGQDIFSCDSIGQLNAVIDSIGTGRWNVLSGTINLGNPTAYNSSYNGLAVGTTVLEWVISNGPCAVSRDTVEVTRYPTPAAPLITGDLSICQGSGTVLTASSPVSGGTFSWWNAATGGTLLDTSAVYPTGPVSGSTTLFVEVTDPATGCSSGRYPVNIVAQTALPVDLGNDTTVCAIDTLCLDASGPGLTGFSWSSGDTTPVACIVGGGTIIVTATDTNNCSDMDTIQVNTIPGPTVNLGADTSICQGASVTLGGSPVSGVTYLWNTGATTSQITVSSAGTYSLTTTDSSSCGGFDEINISTNPATVAAFGIDSSNCPEIVFSDSSTGATSWYWTFGNGNVANTQNPSTSYLTAGNGAYVVTLVSSGPCGTDTTDQTVIIECVIGIADALEDARIQVVPNPNGGNFRLLAENLGRNDFTMEVMNSAGKLVYQMDVENHSGSFVREIDLQSQPSGIYYLRLRVGGSEITRKVLIQK